MSCRCDFITDKGLQYIVTSWYCHLKSENVIFIYFNLFLKFICAYLGISWPIFSQIWICYSWYNTLSITLSLTFHFDDVIMVKYSIKGDKFKFREFTCYVYGSFIFLKSWAYMTLFFVPYLAYCSGDFSEILICCSWDFALCSIWSQIFK